MNQFLFNKNLKITMIVIFIFIVGLIFLIFTLEKQYKIKQHLHEQAILFNSVYHASYDKYHSMADTIYNSIINKQKIIDIFKYSSNLTKKDETRKELYNALLPDYTLLQNQYIKQLHFHLPNNRSYLRMHAKNIFGDDLNLIRESVVHVSENHKAIHGFEEGKLSNGFRFVYPLFDDKKYIGSVEISFSALSILTSIMDNYNVYTNMLIRKNVVDRTVPDELTYYIQSPLKDFYFEKRVINELGSKFNPNKNAKEMQEKIGPRLLSGELFSVYNKFQDRVITFIPIRHTITNELQAYIILNSHSDYIQNKITTSKTMIILNIALFGIILLFIYREIISKTKLKNSEEKTRSILNATASIIILSDGEKIMEVNDAFFKFFSEFKTIKSFNKIYKNLCSVLKPIDKENFIACGLNHENYSIEDIVDNDKTTFKTAIEKDNTLYYFIINIQSKYIQNTQMYLIELTDISNEVALSENVKAKDIQLFEKHKMAQMGEMINNIAHQWRQPLAIINTVVSIMKEKSLQNRLQHQEIDKKLSHIEETTAFMSETIEDFLNFHKPLKSRELFNVNEVLISTIKIISPSLDANNIQIIKKCELQLNVMGYKREFSQVLLIIIANAKEALLANKTPNPFIKIELNKTALDIELVIEDNAGGINEEIVSKIFEPYYSTKSLEQGSGLGLYIAKMIIENSMNGSIESLNTVDGVKFIIRIKNCE